MQHTAQKKHNADIEEDYKTHFAFGENWSAYSKNISETHVNEAKSNFARLLGTDSIEGKDIIDIGCGSGIHALCALQMGAKTLTAVDIDENSLATTKSTLEKFWPDNNYTCKIGNILRDFDAPTQKFDIVYSWGVLHHTGNMWQAIENASNLVKPGGTFILAIYTKTPMCSFWEKEKKLYSKSPKPVRILITGIYASLMILGYCAKGINPIKKIKNYNQNRGMSWWHDCIDWLGGWPYQSASPQEIESFLNQKGFTQKSSFNTKKRIGILGTGCAEYTFMKEDA